MKPCLCIAGLLLSVGLLGCKPKTTTVTGQIFIVTRGAENIKLGAVEVLLIEKSQVADFLQRRELVVKAQIALRQKMFVDAKTEAEKLQTEYDLFEANRPDFRDGHNDLFLLNSFFKTYPNYENVKSEVHRLWQQSDALNKQAKLLEAQKSQAGFNYSSIADQQGAVMDRGYRLWEQADALLEKMNDFVNAVQAEKRQKLDAAESKKVRTEYVFVNSPAVEDYLMDFSPRIVQKTLTDADGKFSFAYPREKSLAIFASGQRTVLNSTEKYYWLVDAPGKIETAQVFLSNNNLVFVDPGGYFKLKPKQAVP